MSKFTEGPWHLANGVQIRSRNHQIAKVWMFGRVEGKANANLIKAAPELYEALKELMICREYGDVSESADVWDMVRAALKKADGDQS